MKIYSTSQFKDPVNDHRYFEEWVGKLERHNGRTYERIQVQTSLGKTHVWGLNTQDTHRDALVIFPGARTTALIWDFDRGIDQIGHPLRIFMVETNGLPNLSDGATPDIRSLDYGVWAKEVLESRVRRTGGVTAHPFGLYLVDVEYRDEFELPERFIGPHFLTGFSELGG